MEVSWDDLGERGAAKVSTLPVLGQSGTRGAFFTAEAQRNTDPPGSRGLKLPARNEPPGLKSRESTLFTCHKGRPAGQSGTYFPGVYRDSVCQPRAFRDSRLFPPHRLCLRTGCADL